MQNEKINICQVSLARDISIVKENYFNFNKLYKNLKFYIICQNKDLSLFKSAFDFENCKIVNEDEILSLKDFRNIFTNLSKNLNYREELEQRLTWYYQQVLKLSFAIDFIYKSKEKIVIWDADTIILKKITFFQNNYSVKYGTTSEFHRAYYDTNKKILKKLPNYFISSLAQFISLSTYENRFLNKKLNQFIKRKNTTPEWITHIVFKAITEIHENYNGSMFSEYELIGQSNYLQNNTKQKPILTLRFGLDGILNHKQIRLVKMFNFKHVTYEHSHPNKKSLGMLDREQTWLGLIKIIYKNLFKFYLRSIKHNYLYKKNYG